MNLFQELLDEAEKYDISAQLDSNGKEVKIPKINQSSSVKTLPVVGEIWVLKYNKNRFKVTKVQGNFVYSDMIDKDDNLIDGHSGNNYYRNSINHFVANYRKE